MSQRPKYDPEELELELKDAAGQVLGANGAAFDTTGRSFALFLGRSGSGSAKRFEGLDVERMLSIFQYPTESAHKSLPRTR